VDNQRKRKIAFLRASYWLGAVADAIVGVRMLMPQMMGEAQFRYAMGTSAALMFGWTVLLIWADRKPVERKGVLLITICPVLAGLMLATVRPLLDGVFPVSRMIPIWVVGAGIIALMGFSYYQARDIE
jgi:hypothetical protein